MITKVWIWFKKWIYFRQTLWWTPFEKPS